MKKKDLISLLDLLKQYYAETGFTEAQSLIRNIQSMAGTGTAGRKPLYNAEIRRMILRLHEEGGSIRRIADLTGCSVGYVHKIIHNSQGG